MKTIPFRPPSSNPLPPGSRAAAFSDNDRLAALVMSGLEGDALVLLTNVDGLLRSGSPEASSHADGDEASDVISLVERNYA